MDYKLIYDSIINKALSLNRKRRKGGQYFEEHHIVPTCMGGLSFIDNKVLLTAREHFICHKLLVEIYPDNIKLQYAIWMMVCTKKSGVTYRVGAREFERLKIIHSKNVSVQMSGSNNPFYGKGEDDILQEKRHRTYYQNRGLPIPEYIKVKDRKKSKEILDKKIWCPNPNFSNRKIPPKRSGIRIKVNLKVNNSYLNLI